jgi:hypothetical protein
MIASGRAPRLLQHRGAESQVGATTFEGGAAPPSAVYGRLRTESRPNGSFVRTDRNRNDTEIVGGISQAFAAPAKAVVMYRLISVIRMSAWRCCTNLTTVPSRAVPMIGPLRNVPTQSTRADSY